MRPSTVLIVAAATAPSALARAQESPREGASSAKDAAQPSRKDARKPDFRKVYWDASIDEVKASETGQPDSETDCSLTYSNAKQWGVPGAVLYEFSEGKLIRGTFTCEGSGSFQTIWRRYSELERRLSSQYPRPLVNDRRWKGYKDRPGLILPPNATPSERRAFRDANAWRFDKRTVEPADDADLLSHCRDGSISCYIVWKNKRSQATLEIGKDSCAVKMQLSRE